MTLAIRCHAPILALFSLLGPLGLAAQEPSAGGGATAAARNLDFESGDVGAEPTGWRFVSQAGGTCVLIADGAFAGNQAAFVDASELTDAPSRLSGLMQSIDAVPYRGQRVRYRGAVKVAQLDGGGRVQMWLRVDLPKGEDGQPRQAAFDNMGDRPITDLDWRHHEIVLDVAEDAERLAFGLFVNGTGKAWFDDVSLAIVTDEPAAASAQPQQPAAPAPDPVAPEPEPVPAPVEVERMQNPKLEQGDAGEPPVGWRFGTSTGGKVAVETEGAFEGRQCVCVDATEAEVGARSFPNLMQSVDAAGWRGKRVRFRAAVKAGQLTAGSRVQLWMRVDRPQNVTGAFDNMGDRPITGAEWDHYEIVLDVADDATRIVFGMFLMGQGKAWIDDASLEVVAADVQPTAKPSPASTTYRMDPLVRKALDEAHLAPQQPFWTPWLLLVAIAVGLFVVGLWPARAAAPADEAAGETPRADVGPLRWFAFRFTAVYWLLYCLPRPLNTLIYSIPEVGPEWGAAISSAHAEVEASLAGLLGRTLFGLAGPLVPPNGSGDTTQGYLTLLAWFVLALLVATVWTFAVGRRPRREIGIDLLRSYLRYVLAAVMLSYGIAKIRITGNQFSEISGGRLLQTWGDSSPMGVVWKFMGSSRPYTVFSGIGEIVAAVFLIWRRTALLGAVVAIGVMTNVVMLNYCYDVPVKIFSTHLLLMGLLVTVPDIRRLVAIFVANRSSGGPAVPCAWSGPVLRWVRIALKSVVVAVCFGMPLWHQGVILWDHFTAEGGEATAAEAQQGEDQPLLKRRGYRWINEVPFNR